MQQHERERYSRQIKLPQIGEDGQEKFLSARVLIIGMGGLGSPVAMYLAAAGVGHLVISDFDHVDTSNLQRQIIHDQDSLGESKATSAARRINALNPNCRVDVFDYELDDEELENEVRHATVIVDCTDNFTSRFELNRLSLKFSTPLASAAAVRFEAQISTFDPRRADTPCYQCLYPDTSIEGATCAGEGVMAPLVGIVGSIQAMEALKVILDMPGTLTGRLLLVDTTTMEFTSLVLPKNSSCPACSENKY
jgi:molybdopterin-synthase adenylyltransferase